MVVHAKLDLLAARLGAQYLLRDPADMRPYLVDWLGKYEGNAAAIALPGSTDDVVAIVKFAVEHGYALVPQGGNTSMSGGATPEADGNAIVISLKRMRTIIAMDPTGQTMTAEAGCILADLQAAARTSGMLFPLSFGAEGSSTIGGAMATSAGGTAVLRYGNARDLALGLEVVLPDGRVWNGLRPLRKDSTGYGLRHLFIGSEGTLGIITKVTVRLFPEPRSRSTAYVAVSSLEQALTVLERVRHAAADRLTAFEFIAGPCAELIAEQVAHARRPFPDSYPAIVLIEMCDTCFPEDLDLQFETLLAGLYEAELILDAVTARDVDQSNQFWQFREGVSEALVKAGKGVKHDVSIPIAGMAAFVSETDALVAAAARDARAMLFGHLGDGNLHYNFIQGVGQTAEDFLAAATEITRIVHDQVFRHGGSISAEHGIGKLRVDELPRYKDSVEYDLMLSFKNLLDPQNLFNPGKLLLPPGEQS